MFINLSHSICIIQVPLEQVLVSTKITEIQNYSHHTNSAIYKMLILYGISHLCGLFPAIHLSHFDAFLIPTHKIYSISPCPICYASSIN